MGELKGALNCLKTDLETARCLISLTWEKIELVEKNERRLVGRRSEVSMIAGGSNDNIMQVDG